MNNWIRKIMISAAAAAAIACLVLFFALATNSSSTELGTVDPNRYCDTVEQNVEADQQRWAVPAGVTKILLQARNAGGTKDSTEVAVVPFEEIVVDSNTVLVQYCAVYSFNIVDAGFGTGLSCPRFVNEDMLPRADLLNIVDVEEPTVLFDSHFDDELSDVTVLSGDWSVANSALNQTDHCGSDLTALLNTEPVKHFSIEAEFSSIDTANNAGLAFGYASIDSRAGATLVDLTEGGQRLRWGYYDEAGYYQYLGSRPVSAVGIGESITLTVQVRNGQVETYLNGVRIAGFAAENTEGQIGLTTTQSAVAFDQVTLTALPASSSTATPDQSEVQKVGGNRNISNNINTAG